jgi:archaemetzincin
MVVHLVPIGVVPQEMLDQVVKGLREHAPVDPVLEQAQDFPASARSPDKNRYRAAALLDWLANLPIDKTGKIMGITESDIFHPKGNIPRWGILGLGSLDGRCSVLSTWRMKRKWENGGAPDWLVRERLWKTAIHELGHTLGLEHCPTVGCIMEDGHGTVKTTDREKELCPECAGRYLQAIERIGQ